MKFVLTEPITIPPGTEFEVCDDLGAGGLEYRDDRGYMRVFLGRAAALEQGMVVARPVINLVQKEPT
jgi:hypothetical protein